MTSLIARGLDAERLERPEHGPALHHQPRVDQVVAVGADQAGVREGDHAGRLALRLQLLVAAKAIRRALQILDRRPAAPVEREDVALGGNQRRERCRQSLRSCASRSFEPAVSGVVVRAVLELLLGAEQPVEHRLAQVLAERDRERGAEQGDHQQPAPAAPLALAAQLVGRLAKRLGGGAQVALHLLVLGDRLHGPLAVRHPLVRVPGRLEGVANVVSQLLVLDQAPHIRIGARRTGRLTRLLGPRAGALCHSPTPSSASLVLGAYTPKWSRYSAASRAFSIRST